MLMALRAGSWRRWFAAALPWIFVLGVAAARCCRCGDWVQRSLPSRSRQPGGARCRDDLEAAGKSGRASCRRCHPHDRWRHVRGAGASRARSRPDDARSLRGIDAPEMKASCAQELQMAEAATDALRVTARRGRRHDLQYRAGQIYRPRRRRRRDQRTGMFRRRCSRRVMPAATAAAIATAGVRTQVKSPLK